ncbi:putative sporulation protein YtxC [Desulfonispora thiosulfatigenes DSM 11270]|uniref:Putative sporulation protein YtxC n=1 Tax=Desulfonispora thiosulfatigenes DSM 11270 TaxID=656914 RepID=A0A1W1VRP5_DESTI|nr:putative sporulation protein YtxC [Desulfonispora thiosulfatigenes]SMB96027.1 putative sporulation protein YtxC [Desulfonispora thiosulfatigenes DSM 11270]
MQEPILIGTKNNPELLIDKFKHEIATLGLEEKDLAYKINYKGDIAFLDCDKPGRTISTEKLKNLLAKIVTNIIMDDWAHILVKKVIRDQYYYFNKEEKTNIEDTVIEIFKDKESGYSTTERKNKVMKRVLEDLDKHQELVLEGFVNFRLKDLMFEIEKLVDSSVDEFIMEKEYLEFIRLLKYFVDIQEPKVEEVNITLGENDFFNLVNKDGSKIESEYLNGFTIDYVDHNINYEDLLISALITLAPRYLVVHLGFEDKYKDTYKTIKNVFGKKVGCCKGCELCK